MPHGTKPVDCGMIRCSRCRWLRLSKRATAVGFNDGGHVYECSFCCRAVRQTVLSYIYHAKWRLETSIIKYICSKEPTWTESRVVDELFRMVTAGELAWFGAEEAKVGPVRALADPLKYKYIKGLITDNAINLAS
jgi:hypothetical protein